MIIRSNRLLAAAAVALVLITSCTDQSTDTEGTSPDLSTSAAHQPGERPADAAVPNSVPTIVRSSPDPTSLRSEPVRSESVGSDSTESGLATDELDKPGDDRTTSELRRTTAVQAEVSETTASPPIVETSPVRIQVENESEIQIFDVGAGGTLTVEDGIHARYADDDGTLKSLGTCSYNDDGFAAVVTFVRSFQSSLRFRDPAVVAPYIDFPLRVNAGSGERIDIPDFASFVAKYDEIFTPEWIAAVTELDPLTAFCNYRGFMMGRGLFWAYPDPGVYAINQSTFVVTGDL